MTKKITMKNFLDLEINLEGDQTETDFDLGSITLSLDGKEFVFDIIQSYREFEDGITTVTCEVEIDKETFPDCKFDLTDLDLLSSKLKGEIYFMIDEIELFKDATMYVKVRQTTKAINLILD